MGLSTAASFLPAWGSAWAPLGWNRSFMHHSLWCLLVLGPDTSLFYPLPSRLPWLLLVWPCCHSSSWREAGAHLAATRPCTAATCCTQFWRAAGVPHCHVSPSWSVTIRGIHIIKICFFSMKRLGCSLVFGLFDSVVILMGGHSLL